MQTAIQVLRERAKHLSLEIDRAEKQKSEHLNALNELTNNTNEWQKFRVELMDAILALQANQPSTDHYFNRNSYGSPKG